MRVTDRVREIARHTATTLGYPSIADQIEVWEDKDGVQIRMDCRDMVNNTLSIAKSKDALRWLRDGSPQHAHLELRFSDMVRLEVRRGHVGDLEPAWGCAMPTPFAQLLDRFGIDADDLFARRRDMSWDGVQLDARPDVDLSLTSVHSGRLHGALTFEERDGVLLSVVAGGAEDGDCTVTVTGLDIPETLAASIRGMPLSTIVSHEDLDACPETIVDRATRRRRNGERIVDLHLVPDISWRGAVPAGADTSWRDLRMGALLPEA